MLDNIDIETELKMTALMDSNYPESFFINEVAKSDMNIAMNIAMKVFNDTYKKGKKHRLYTIKLRNVMKPFLDEYFKRFSHKHIIILNIITNGIKGYWIGLYKKHHKQIEKEIEKELNEKDNIEREDTFNSIMKELDNLLENTIPLIDKRLTKLGIKKTEIKKKEEVKVDCYCGGLLCFCVDLKGNYIR